MTTETQQEAQGIVPEPTPEIKRKAFYDELAGQSVAFAAKTLDVIPELESIAVVFSYAVPNENLPVAVVMGKLGPLKTPAEYMHLIRQLMRTAELQFKGAQGVVKEVDNYMAQQAAELQHLQEQIHAAKRELANPGAGPG